MELKLFLRFVLVLLLFKRFCYADISQLSGSQKNLEVLKHLKSLNKPPVKSIKSPDGDIIDCVHISHQPAFDHPLLKNHTIKMTPNSNPMWKKDNVKMSSTMNASSSLENQEAVSQLWHSNGKCPKGTIPIRRTRKEDVLRATSVNNYGKKKKRFSTVAQPNSINPDLDDPKNHEPRFHIGGVWGASTIQPLVSATDLNHYANFYINHQNHVTISVGGELYGGKASLNLWNPRIQNFDEFSLGQIWVIGESYESESELLDVNTIEAGWQVFPGLYGDSNTRLFIYWTSDSYQSAGCYNLECSGFIQTSNEIVLGGTISPVSEMLGAQYDITIFIWKDPEDGNWWMQLGNGEVLGYWPSAIFSYLQKSATRIDWGGEVMNLPLDWQHTTTQMGSGQFAQEEYKAASYVKNIQIVDGSNTLRDPTSIVPSTERPNCYTIQTGVDDSWGTYFYYGGPGRNPYCP